ncbi:MAG: PIN domain-containing protein [Chitinivibrionales bacterium]|nr:PIN domain-containing protein [Chitinivibrionales bacterium]
MQVCCVFYCCAPAKPSDLESVVEALVKNSQTSIIHVDLQHWLAALKLRIKTNDPADRVVAATASRHNCPHVTTDKRIAQFYHRILK